MELQPTPLLQDHLICGYSAELNVISDMHWMVSFDQLRLLQTLLASVHIAAKEEEEEEESPEELQETQEEVSSVGELLGAALTPFSVLLTARGVSLALADLCPDAESFRLILLARADHPYSLARLEPSQQRVVLSCFDLRLRLPSAAAPPLSEADILALLAPRSSDPQPDWLLNCLSSRPGTPSPKTGVAPSLYTLEWTDFLEQPGALRCAIERPLHLRLDADLLDALFSQLDRLAKLWGPRAEAKPRKKTKSAPVAFAALRSVALEVGPVAITAASAGASFEAAAAGLEARALLEVRCPREWHHFEGRLRLHLLRLTDTAASLGAASRLMLAPAEVEARGEASRFASGLMSCWSGALLFELSGAVARIGQNSLRAAMELSQRLGQLAERFGGGGQVEKGPMKEEEKNEEVLFADDLRAAGQYSYSDALGKSSC